jgi:Cysteine-rich CPXCG
MEEFEFHCPYCGELNTAELEWTFTGSLVQDCWVCCHPIHLTVRRDEWGDPQVSAEREGG